MAVLVDSNVLIFCIQQEHPWHEQSIRAMATLLEAGEPACVLLQNIAEFWNVCTRPLNKNGLGLSPTETEQRLKNFDLMLTVMHDTPAVYDHWRTIVAKHEVIGVQVHDARIAAAMQVHEISRILTYNPRDFNRYEGITTVHPADIR